MLKSRYTGDVGIAAHLQYDKESGRLTEVEYSDIDFTSDNDLAFD